MSEGVQPENVLASVEKWHENMGIYVFSPKRRVLEGKP